MTTQIIELPDKILDFCDLSRAEHEDAGMPFWQHIKKRYEARGLGECPDLVRQITANEIEGEVSAQIAGGRWILICLVCRTPVVGCYHDPYFLCPSCGNADNPKIWKRAIFPENREEIESLLIESIPGFRDSAPGRGWLPSIAIPSLVGVE